MEDQELRLSGLAVFSKLANACQPLADVSKAKIQVNKMALIRLANETVCPLQGLVEHAQNAGYSVLIYFNRDFIALDLSETQLQDKLLIPILSNSNCFSTNNYYVNISDDDLLAADRTDVEIAIKPQEEDLKKMQQYLRRLYYWFLLGPLITLEWLRRQEKLCCMSGGQQAEGGRVPEETTVESGLNSAADYGETLRNYNQEAEHEQTRGETQPLLLVSNGHTRPRAIRRVLNYLTRKLFGKLQSWTKVLGQICTCGAFSHAPNKQSRVNSNTLALRTAAIGLTLTLSFSSSMHIIRKLTKPRESLFDGLAEK